jgi:hypothetical protein
MARGEVFPIVNFSVERVAQGSRMTEPLKRITTIRGERSLDLLDDRCGVGAAEG